MSDYNSNNKTNVKEFYTTVFYAISKVKSGDMLAELSDVRSDIW